MDKEDIQHEIMKYVQSLETNYTESIRDLKQLIEKEKQKQRKEAFAKVSEAAQKNDLESLFVECIEEVRKEIMRRRLKNEIYNKKKFQQIDKNTQEAKEFEQSLLKLAQLAKNRVKLGDFTSKDKSNLLDLFVNNEKTLLKIYEILFPHRANPSAAQGISSNIAASEVNTNIYGSNAIKALNSSVNASMVSVQNIEILNQLGDVTATEYLPNIGQGVGKNASKQKLDT